MFWGLNFHCFPVLDGHQPNRGLAIKGGMDRMSLEPGAGLFDPTHTRQMVYVWNKHGNKATCILYIHMQNAYHT